VLDDVLVVFKKSFRGQLVEVQQLRCENVVEMMDIVFVQPL